MQAVGDFRRDLARWSRMQLIDDFSGYDDQVKPSDYHMQVRPNEEAIMTLRRLREIHTASADSSEARVLEALLTKPGASSQRSLAKTVGLKRGAVRGVMARLRSLSAEDPVPQR
jgi:hypothetical protein